MPITTSALRSKILASKPARVESVFIEDWEATIYVHELSLGQRDAFEAMQVGRTSDGSVRLETVGLKARLVIMTACDEEGNQIFEDSDIDALSETGAAAVEKVFTVAQRVNRMRKDDLDDEESSLAHRRNGASDSD